MIRHGESEWNQKNLFCGWFDADLSPKGNYNYSLSISVCIIRYVGTTYSFKWSLFFWIGREEALSAGKALKAEGYQFDIAHTSVLKRAQITLNSVLQEIGQTDIPINKTWRLNERHYGGLTGLDKAETAAKYGEAQVGIFHTIFFTAA